MTPSPSAATATARTQSSWRPSSRPGGWVCAGPTAAAARSPPPEMICPRACHATAPTPRSWWPSSRPGSLGVRGSHSRSAPSLPPETICPSAVNATAPPRGNAGRVRGRVVGCAWVPQPQRPVVSRADPLGSDTISKWRPHRSGLRPVDRPIRADGSSGGCRRIHSAARSDVSGTRVPRLNVEKQCDHHTEDCVVSEALGEPRSASL